jgi:hypothetical protein
MGGILRDDRAAAQAYVTLLTVFAIGVDAARAGRALLQGASLYIVISSSSRHNDCEVILNRKIILPLTSIVSDFIALH